MLISDVAFASTSPGGLKSISGTLLLSCVTIISFPIKLGRYLPQEWARRKARQRLWLEVTQIAESIASILVEAHRMRIAHRDIKPENILVPDSGKNVATDPVCILDFGLTYMVSPNKPDQESIQCGELVFAEDELGTPLYESPEQRTRNAKVSLESDVYSLGLVLYEMLTGRKALQQFVSNESPSDGVLRSQVTPDIPPLRSIHPEIPKTLEAIVQRATRHEPSERLSMLNLHSDLANFLNHKETLSRPLKPHQKLGLLAVRRPLVTLLTSLLVTTITALLVQIIGSLATRAKDAEASSARLATEKTIATADALLTSNPSLSGLLYKEAERTSQRVSQESSSGILLAARGNHILGEELVKAAISQSHLLRLSDDLFVRQTATFNQDRDLIWQSAVCRIENSGDTQLPGIAVIKEFDDGPSRSRFHLVTNGLTIEKSSRLLRLHDRALEEYRFVRVDNGIEPTFALRGLSKEWTFSHAPFFYFDMQGNAYLSARPSPNGPSTERVPVAIDLLTDSSTLTAAGWMDEEFISYNGSELKRVSLSRSKNTRPAMTLLTPSDGDLAELQQLTGDIQIRFYGSSSSFVISSDSSSFLFDIDSDSLTLRKEFVGRLLLAFNTAENTTACLVQSSLVEIFKHLHDTPVHTIRPEPDFRINCHAVSRNGEYLAFAAVAQDRPASLNVINTTTLEQQSLTVPARKHWNVLPGMDGDLTVVLSNYVLPSEAVGANMIRLVHKEPVSDQFSTPSSLGSLRLSANPSASSLPVADAAPNVSLAIDGPNETLVFDIRNPGTPEASINANPDSRLPGLLRSSSASSDFLILAVSNQILRFSRGGDRRRWEKKVVLELPDASPVSMLEYSEELQLLFYLHQDVVYALPDNSRIPIPVSRTEAGSQAEKFLLSPTIKGRSLLLVEYIDSPPEILSLSRTLSFSFQPLLLERGKSTDTYCLSARFSRNPMNDHELWLAIFYKNGFAQVHNLQFGDDAGELKIRPSLFTEGQLKETDLAPRLQFSPDTKRLFVGRQNREQCSFVEVDRSGLTEKLFSLPRPPSAGHPEAVWASDSKTLYLASDAGLLQVDPLSVSATTVHENNVISLGIIPCGINTPGETDKVVTLEEDQSGDSWICMANTATICAPSRILIPAAENGSLRFSDDCTTLFAAARSQFLYAFDPRNPKAEFAIFGPQQEIVHHDFIVAGNKSRQIAFFRNGYQLSDDSLRLFSAANDLFVDMAVSRVYSLRENKWLLHCRPAKAAGGQVPSVWLMQYTRDAEFSLKKICDGNVTATKDELALLHDLRDGIYALHDFGKLVLEPSAIRQFEIKSSNFSGEKQTVAHIVNERRIVIVGFDHFTIVEASASNPRVSRKEMPARVRRQQVIEISDSLVLEVQGQDWLYVSHSDGVSRFNLQDLSKETKTEPVSSLGDNSVLLIPPAGMQLAFFNTKDRTLNLLTDPGTAAPTHIPMHIRLPLRSPSVPYTDTPDVTEWSKQHRRWHVEREGKTILLLPGPQLECLPLDAFYSATQGPQFWGQASQQLNSRRELLSSEKTMYVAKP
ncbi:hypothetical protein E3A20_04770 [Planctomyces bekefii]|uniref:Protein kinase domain-containing protein n=1 Tax=Planctomyces bekefii TaxID=1653850 RepID=A0A5C6M9Q2_9PLAN|nr:hypothetical protein E3A20_04770 [Planctomyces bekefii]